MTVLYDEDCGFCRWTLSKLLLWDRRRAIRPVPIGSGEGGRLLGDMPEEPRWGSWHLAEADGIVRSAGAGFSPLFRTLPGGRPIAALAERFPGAADRLYRSVAGNRTFFGRRLSDGAKRRADARIAERR